MCQTQPNRALQVTNLVELDGWTGELDGGAKQIAEATQEYAGYASYEKHATLQSGIVAIGAVVDRKIHQVLSGVELLEENPDDIIAIVDQLISTAKSLTIRTVAYPSALICISTAQKLIVLLEMINMREDSVPENFGDTRDEWLVAVKKLSKANAKWAKLQVPGSLVRLAQTQLELSIMSIPDPEVNITVL